MKPDHVLTSPHERTRTVGIVEIKDGGLTEHVRCAEAGRVLRVALQLCRTAHVVLGEQRISVTAHRHGRRKEHRTSRNEFFRLANVRDQFLRGLPGAGTHAGQSQRRAHQFQERSAARRVAELRRLNRELAVQVVVEFWRVSQLFEAAPIGFAFEASQTISNRGEIHRVFS
jgi:hypothetical protein